MSEELVTVGFVDRPNRFVVRGRRDDGVVLVAYLPNTGRLTHLCEPGRPWIFRRARRPDRRTEYTAIRAWDGAWVAPEASRAPELLADWLEAGHPLGPFGGVVGLEREVRLAGHRLDLRVDTEAGSVWVEVKSGGRGRDGTALLSQTPSARGAAHLELLGRLVADGELAAAAFVVQRPDVERLLVGGDADPGWIEAVTRARDARVAILAYGCTVTPERVGIAGEIPVVWAAE